MFINPDKPLPSPLPNPIDWALRKFFPRWCRCVKDWKMDRAVVATKNNYARQLGRIRSKFERGEKIRVLFIVKDLAKWKAASLYATMRDDDRYDPMIGLTYQSVRYATTPSAADGRIQQAKDWFQANGYSSCVVYDALRDRMLDLRRFQPDIVFYPEVWYDPKEHSPVRVSRFALTCYIPYFVPNYVNINLDCQQDMHRLYWRHIVLNDDLANQFRDATQDRIMAGDFIGLGHTMFDAISECAKQVVSVPQTRRIVIYAPHWTFDHPRNKCAVHYSTFAQDGKTILEYAKRHQEFKWVFKPHPSLRDRLESSGFMTKEAVDEYYSEWERIGEVCLSGDYERLFADSYAMITDCGSFLSEYGATRHPIIHLISSKNTETPPETIKRLYDTYYQAHNEDELKSWLVKVLELKEDPNREERLNALNDLGFCGQNSAKNIVEYLEGAFGGEADK